MDFGVTLVSKLLKRSLGRCQVVDFSQVVDFGPKWSILGQVVDFGPSGRFWFVSFYRVQVCFGVLNNGFRVGLYSLLG